ncbi:hypothetical protein BDV29DRAFT_156331 [Aspergillus leporis]|uniref:Uncharacterized protein n=1 Tax=Aspergillus leporis TaxID=41062 RepID=A0A5N5X5J7_9EURO|nr:hypothetical protein BDV29DRAFT_156331 [Aspergillus leporis]
MHCFGHIHAAWGVKLVTWRKTVSEKPSHFTDTDNGKSKVVTKLLNLMELDNYVERLCYATSHYSGALLEIQWGMQTLFVNAAIEGIDTSGIDKWVLIQAVAHRARSSHANGEAPPIDWANVREELYDYYNDQGAFAAVVAELREE